MPTIIAQRHLPTPFTFQHSLTANPTTRPDGSALVAGDRIVVPPNTLNQGRWVFDGLYWRSETLYYLFDTATWTVVNISANTNGSPTGKIFRADCAIYATRITTVYQCSPTLNASNRWDIVLFRSNSSAGAVSLTSPGTNVQFSTEIPSGNFQPNNNSDRLDSIIFQYQRVGSPSNLVARSVLEYQIIRP